jgi:hypothetical protein
LRVAFVQGPGEHHHRLAVARGLEELVRHGHGSKRSSRAPSSIAYDDTS